MPSMIKSSYDVGCYLEHDKHLEELLSQRYIPPVADKQFFEFK